MPQYILSQKDNNLQSPQDMNDFPNLSLTCLRAVTSRLTGNMIISLRSLVEAHHTESFFTVDSTSFYFCFPCIYNREQQ